MDLQDARARACEKEKKKKQMACGFLSTPQKQVVVMLMLVFVSCMCVHPSMHAVAFALKALCGELVPHLQPSVHLSVANVVVRCSFDAGGGCDPRAASHAAGGARVG